MLAALSANVTRYSVPRLNGLAGVKLSALPCTFTWPAVFGSMANAAPVVAGSIGWSKVTTTGAARIASSPRSGVTLTTVGGSGARVGVGSGAAVAAQVGWWAEPPVCWPEPARAQSQAKMKASAMARLSRR